MPKSKPIFTGKAGEFAVMSELLFHEFNVSAMTVDDGIDVVASKNNKYFHIQVKTSNINQKGGFSFQIKNERFRIKGDRDTIYIFVMREVGKTRHHNDYLIIHSNQIRNYIANGIIKNKDNLTISVVVDQRNGFLLNKSENVTNMVNNFDHIK